MRTLALVLALLAGCARTPPSGLASTSSAECARCHAEQAADFAASAHGHASASPVLEAMLPRVEARWGAAARARCTGCHAPPHGEDQALGCVSCHAAVGNTGTHDGRLVLDLDAPILGAGTSEGAPHATRTTSGLLRASTLCATCHEVTGPGLFVEHTGSEHASAVRASGAPECVTCHVPPTTGESGARHDHRFVGMDPPWDGSEAERAAAVEASRELLASALELRIVDGTIELENVGAGHAVPTGAAFLRDVWVDVEVTLDDGTTQTRVRVVDLADRPMLGTEPVALVTDADRVEEHRLAPFEVRRAALEPGVVHATATLRARAIRAEALEALAIDPARVPEVVVATASF